MSQLLAAKHPTCVPEEREAHEQFWEGLVRNETVDLQVIPQFLISSGLPRRSLREVWSVANPCVEFPLSLSRRLIGHCQAMRDDQEKSHALNRWPTGCSIIEKAASTRLRLCFFSIEWPEISHLMLVGGLFRTVESECGTSASGHALSARLALRLQFRSSCHKN